jgi:amino acid adenylation domain-containing protein
MVGLFIATLPARVRVRPEAFLLPWLHALQSQQVAARQYEYSPLEQVQGWSDVPRGVSLFESIVVYENYPRPHSVQGRCGGLEIRQVYFASRTHYPLTVVAVPGPALVLRIGYQCQRFEPATIAQMLDHFRTLLAGLATAATQRLVDLPMLTTAERHQLLVEWNDTQREYPQDMCVQQWFEAQVARMPDAVAVTCEEQALTYWELNARANQLAHYLQAQGVGPEILVGICVEPAVEMVVGLLGILKAGGAYVPLDPAYPPARLAFILADTRMRVLLTQQALLPRLPQHAAHVLCLDTDWPRVNQESPAPTDSEVTADNVVYMLYTSGSTGQPKGVMIEQRSLVNYLCWCKDTLFGQIGHPIPLVTNLTFDASLKQLFVPLLLGQPVWILPSQAIRQPEVLRQALQTHSAVRLNCVPSLWETLLDTSDTRQAEALGKSLTSLWLGGERITADLLHRTLAVLPSLRIWTLYGPTEATANASAAILVAAEHSTIGRPIANTQLYVLHAHLHPVPVGLPGELHIGGTGLARGYLHQPALTAERFLPHPFSPKPGARLYKTGDLARYRPDGQIEFLDRLDHQVKLRGYRIELGEIEVTLERHPAIRQAVVLARQDTSDARRLVAYCLPRHQPMPSPDELHSFLHTALPDYMIPAAFVMLEAFPLTPSGKIDRQALPAPGQTRPLGGETFVASYTPTEEILAGIWARVLGTAVIGRYDNFFALGGHSLGALQVLSRLRRVFQVDIPLRALFETPTVAGLARCVERASQTAPPPPLPLLPTMPRREQAPLTMTQEHLWSLDQLLPGAPFSTMPYAVRLTGALHVTALEQSLNAIISRHAVLRTTFTTVAGQPVQVIAPSLRLTIMVEDLSALPDAEQEAEAQLWLRALALYPFDLQKGPLLEVRLLRLGEPAHVLLLAMHHIISDGWSRGVFLDELAVLYEAFCQGKPSPLPDLPLQYVDFAHWQQQWLSSEAGQAERAYWTRQLQEPLPVLQLPTARPRTGELSLRTARQTFQIPGELCAALTRLSHQEGTTLFMTLLAAFKTLLYGYTGQEDVRVGTLVANRHHQETEGLIGLFANLVILRTSLSGNPTLRQVLQRVRITTLEAYTHQQLPFEYLARVLERERHLSRLALFQVMFTMHQVWPHFPPLPGLSSHVLQTQPLEATPCELVVSLRHSPPGLEGLCLYNTALYDAGTMTRMLRDFEQILACLMTQPQQPVSTFSTWQDVRG